MQSQVKSKFPEVKISVNVFLSHVSFCPTMPNRDVVLKVTFWKMRTRPALRGTQRYTNVHGSDAAMNILIDGSGGTVSAARTTTEQKHLSNFIK